MKPLEREVVENGLPAIGRTRTGVEFHPAANLWKYRDGVKAIYLAFEDIAAPPALRLSLKRVLLWYAEHQSPSHLENLFQRFKHFSHTVSLEGDVAASHILNYRSTLDRNTEWYLGSLCGLFRRWYRLSIPGISEDAINVLNTIRVRGNLKGVAVRTMDPEHGRFTDVEMQSILAALKHAYRDGHIDRDAYVLALLFVAFGPRPMQYAAMKICDVDLVQSQALTKTCIISIPSAKRRNRPLRSSFKKRTLDPALGEIVLEHCAEVRARFHDSLHDPGQAPLFPVPRMQGSQSRGFEFHRTGIALSKWFKRTMNTLLVRSERTGNLINVTATRFRRTLACRAADEGHRELVIAELLDHSDTQNVGVYVEASPGMMDRIDRSVALKLAPLAQAFAGTLIYDETHARRAGDPTSRICDPRLDASMRPLGNCGQFGFCGLLAPIACYTCRNFQPWLDGPHDRVLDHLIAERDRLMLSTDKRIASIDDRTILAVAEVVSRCAAAKQNRGEQHG